MDKKKNVLFICHHNNDFDHFLPLIVSLKKEPDVFVRSIAFYNKHDLLKNKVHRYICEQHNVQIDSMTEISYLKVLHKPLSKIYNYVINNVKPGKKVVKRFFTVDLSLKDIICSPRNTLLRIFHFLLERYFQLNSILFLTNKQMSQYIDTHDTKLAIIDRRAIEETIIDTNPFNRFLNAITLKADPMNHVLFRFAKRVREKNIPIMMIPHGPQPILIEMPDRYEDVRPLNNPFRADYLVIGGKREMSIYKNIRFGGLKETLFLGDPRFDLSWINYLESCAMTINTSFEKPKDKKVLLYLMDNFQFVLEDAQKYKLEMHKDILSLVNHFPDLEVWVKHHPRAVFDIPFDDFIKPERQQNIRQFGGDVDIHVLTALADICLSAASTSFISPVLQKKPSIFYEKWKHDYTGILSIFDDLPYKASSQQELIEQYKKITSDQYRIDDSILDSFMKIVFSVDNKSESMTKKYCDKIKQIIQGAS